MAAQAKKAGKLGSSAGQLNHLDNTFFARSL
jgi:hypothetical protein